MFKSLSCWNQQTLPLVFFLKQVPDSEKCPYSQAQTEGPSVKERGCVFVRERKRPKDFKSRQKILRMFDRSRLQAASPCDPNQEIMTPLPLQIWTSVCLQRWWVKSQTWKHMSSTAPQGSLPVNYSLVTAFCLPDITHNLNSVQTRQQLTHSAKVKQKKSIEKLRLPSKC